MPATIVSFAQFQESRQRRLSASPRPGQTVVTPATASPDDTTPPLTPGVPPESPVEPPPRS